MGAAPGGVGARPCAPGDDAEQQERAQDSDSVDEGAATVGLRREAEEEAFGLDAESFEGGGKDGPHAEFAGACAHLTSLLHAVAHTG